MSEDISSQIRTGVTVILVAALVAIILNLMGVAQGILNNGLSNLQSGISRISDQEFENYNQKKPTGVEVKSALSLYAGRDVGILIQTVNARAAKTDPMGTTGNYFNYGSLLGKAGATVPTASVDPQTGDYYTVSAADVVAGRTAGKGHIELEYIREATGLIVDNANTKGTIQSGNAQYILDSARFKSELVKNSTGTIVGIAFTQYN